MATFGEKIQALMDEVYAGWQKEENKGKSKWDVLGTYSEAHQIAVVFGNFNYQVENGGLEQWVYNGYFHDDADKLIEYLETGAELDERCRNLLDRVYKLDQYANETECDRYGYYEDPDDDGGSGFIGDLVDCGAFDTWYYEHCGNDDWWETVSGIIDKTGEHDVALSHDSGEPEDTPLQPDHLETANAHRSLRVYVENTHNERLGGFTMPLPTKPKDLRPFLDNIEINDPQDIRIKEIRSDTVGLDEAVTDAIFNSMSPDALNELNYLAAKIDALHPAALEMYVTILDADRHCGTFAELINLMENLDLFNIQPAFSAEQYGEFLIDTAKDNTSAVFDKLEHSEYSDERELAQYILRLEAHVDAAAYGRAAAELENGVFTESGYLTESEGFREVYRGPEDIPAEYRVVQSATQAKEQTADNVVHVIAPGIKSDEMLGKFLYDNEMLSEKDTQAANARLSFTAFPEDYYRMIGKRRREAGNGSFTQAGYVEGHQPAEKPSVLKQIDTARAKHAVVSEKSAPEKPKSRGPEL